MRLWNTAISSRVQTVERWKLFLDLIKLHRRVCENWREAKRFSRSCICYLVIIIAANSIDSYSVLLLFTLHISLVFYLSYNVNHFHGALCGDVDTIWDVPENIVVCSSSYTRSIQLKVSSADVLSSDRKWCCKWMKITVWNGDKTLRYSRKHNTKTMQIRWFSTGSW